MARTGRPLRAAGILVATFLGVLVLALALLAVVHVIGYGLVLLALVPGLVLVIYLLPGHGEPSRTRYCPRCLHPLAPVAGTDGWRCAACGNVLGP